MSEREIGRKTTLENKIFIILLYFWRTLIDRVADMMRVSIKLNVKCVSLQFQTQWDEKTDEIDRETNSVFCFSSVILIATLRCDRSSNSKWHLTAQHNIAGFLLLPLTTSVSFPFFLLFLWEFTMQTDTHSGSALPALWNKGLIGWCQAVVPLLSLNQSFQQLLSL